MTVPNDLDLTELRQMWQSRRAAMARILTRIDTRGMTRPAREPEEREWLAGHSPDWFVEDEACAEAARAYYARKYRR